MALDNATVLQNLITQRADLQQQIASGQELFVKLTGAIEVLEEIVNSAEEEKEEENTEESVGSVDLVE
jgi:hypothetical protein|tara:strand:+ start:661 stop:864 length:204 start_codon:yes stop_codon:yes gene_type:complete